MSHFNYFIATVVCPGCGREAELQFQADIGVLRFDSYHVGDTIVRESRPGERFPIGPDPACDWARPFWATGLEHCDACDRDVRARIEVRQGRFTAAVPDDGITDDFAWGYLDTAPASSPASIEPRRKP